MIYRNQLLSHLVSTKVSIAGLLNLITLDCTCDTVSTSCRLIRCVRGCGVVCFICCLVFHLFHHVLQHFILSCEWLWLERSRKVCAFTLRSPLRCTCDERLYKLMSLHFMRFSSHNPCVYVRKYSFAAAYLYMWAYLKLIFKYSKHFSVG